MNGDRWNVSAIFFWGQGLATYAWWAWILNSPSSFDLFFVFEIGSAQQRTFFLADMAAFGPLSLAAGTLASMRVPAATPFGWVSVGATAYALFCEVGANGLFARPISEAVMALSLLGGIWATLRMKGR